MLTVLTGKCDWYLFMAFVVDVVDNICNLVWRFYDVSFLLSNFLSSHTCHLGYQELTLYQMVMFLILSEIRARVYVLTGDLVHTKCGY